MRPRLLDLFCGAGGAAMGYHRAGFEVVGVDINPQPNYPFRFIQHDALALVRDALEGCWHTPGPGSIHLGHFDAAHASPPCPAYSTITPDKSKHPSLIPVVRELLQGWGVPYVIENVEGARADMDHPVKLCGSSFGLRVRRHRYFETTVQMLQPPCQHGHQGRPIGVYGDHAQDDEHYRRPDGTLRGNRAKTLDEARAAMGIDWMTWPELADAIPPAFTEYIGEYLYEEAVQ